jgi:hypothetical protein
MATLKEFLLRGRLGGLEAGISVGKVEDLLGAPEATGHLGRRSVIWRYEDLQISFYDGTVSLIGVYPEFGSVALPVPVMPCDYSISRATTSRELREFMRMHAIGLVLDQSLTFDRQICLASEGGVKILLNAEEETLISMQLSEFDLRLAGRR